MVKIIEDRTVKYPLTAEDLEPGQLAECENHTVVVRVSEHNKYIRLELYAPIINIANGCDGYTKLNKFRLLPNATVTLRTRDDSREDENFS